MISRKWIKNRGNAPYLTTVQKYLSFIIVFFLQYVKVENSTLLLYNASLLKTGLSLNQIILKLTLY